MKLLQPVQDFFIGAKGDKEKEIVRRYRENVQQDYLEWAVNAILNWKNDWKPAQSLPYTWRCRQDISGKKSKAGLCGKGRHSFYDIQQSQRC